MPAFHYSGINRRGAAVTGEADAVSAYALVRSLHAEGTFAHAVETLDAPRTWARAGRPLRLEDLNLLTDQLASLTRSGIPLAPALEELANDVRGRRLRRIVEDARRRVEGGESLEEVFARHGDAFPPLYLSLIRVGEQTGDLPAVLQQLSMYGQRHVWLKNRVTVAVAYPAVLLVSLLLFLGLFIPEVVGQFEQMYAQFGGELPWLTAGVLSLGQFVQPVILPLLATAATALLVYRLFLKGTAHRAWWEGLLLGTPAIGPIYRTILSARFFRALGILLDNGAPILESLHLAGAASGSARFAVAARRASASVANGAPVSAAFAETGVLRRSHAWMMEKGESSRTFPAALARLADTCEREADQRQQASLASLGPGLVAICGILVGLAVLACFLPIFQLPVLIQ